MNYITIGKNSSSTVRMVFKDSSGTAIDLSSNTVQVAIPALSVTVTASGVTDGTDGDFTATIPAQSGVEDNQLYDGQLLVSGNSPIEVEFIAQADGDSGTTPDSYVVATNTATVSAAVGGVIPTALGDLSDVSTSGATNGQALVYSSSGGAWGPDTVSGGSSTVYGMNPDSSTQHFFDDFLGEWSTTGNSSWLSGGVSGGGGIGQVHDTDSLEAFGTLKLTDNGGATSCSMLTTKNISKATPADADEIIFEANIKPNTSATGGECGIAIGQAVNSNWENDCLGFEQVGGSTDPYRVILAFQGGSTNFRYAAGNSSDFTLSTSDTSVSASTAYTRLAIKLVYSSSGSNWLYALYINGSSVSGGSGTLDASTQVCAQVYARGLGSGKAPLIDWVRLKYERGTITYVS